MYPVNYDNHFSQLTFQRPNDSTAYATGDVISPAPASLLTFNISNRKVGGYITRGLLLTDRPGQTEALRLHLLSSSVGITPIADNAALVYPYDTVASFYVGYIDFSTFAVPGGSGIAVSEGAFAARPIQYPESSNVLYGILEVRGGFTPQTSQKFTISLYAEASL